MNAALAYPSWMLAAVALSIETGDARICAVAGALGLGLRFIHARGWRGSDGRLALANLVTTLRLVVVVALPVLAARISGVAMTALAFTLLTVDGIDGYLARSRNQSSAFGASYDMETDALGVMLLSLCLHRSGIGAWVLVAGLWRYAFAAAETLAPSLGVCPPSPIYRWFFTALMVSFALAFAPLGCWRAAFAVIGTSLVSFSFLHSLARSEAMRVALKTVRGSARPAGTRVSHDRT